MIGTMLDIRDLQSLHIEKIFSKAKPSSELLIGEPGKHYSGWGWGDVSLLARYGKEKRGCQRASRQMTNTVTFEQTPKGTQRMSHRGTTKARSGGRRVPGISREQRETSVAGVERGRVGGGR